MSIKKKKIFLLVILIIIAGLFIGLNMRNPLLYTENQFGIVGDEEFTLTHLYNVNGVVGAEKNDFTAGEKRDVMDFLANLHYKEPLPPQIDDRYGIPVQLEVKMQDGTKIAFLFWSDIEAIEYDENDKITSRNSYTIDEKQIREIKRIIGIVGE